MTAMVLDHYVPVEILRQIIKWIPLNDYVNLRSSSKTILYKLDQYPVQCFSAYSQSSDLISKLNHSKTHVQLDIADLNEDSLSFIMRNNHYSEFIRLLKCQRSYCISTDAKLRVFRSIIWRRLDASMILALLEDGIFPNTAIKFSCANWTSIGTVMHWACFHSHIDILLFLMAQEDMDWNVKDNCGNAPIHFACSGGNVKVLELLLRLDVDLMAQNNYDEHFMITAAQAGQEEAIKLLLDAGVDGFITDSFNVSSLHYSCLKGYSSIVSVLLNLATEQQVNQATVFGMPIHLAVEYNESEALQVLLADPKVNVNAPNQFNNSPLYISAQNGYAESFELLLRDPRVIFHSEGDGGVSFAKMILRSGVNQESMRLAVEYLDRDV